MDFVLLKVLEGARKIISNPKNWTRGRLARDGFGDHVSPESPEATCFCAIGAIKRAQKDVYGSVYATFEGSLVRELEKSLALEFKVEKPKLHSFNDTHQHEDVLKLFDVTIERAKIERANNEHRRVPR